MASLRHLLFVGLLVSATGVGCEYNACCATTGTGFNYYDPLQPGQCWDLDGGDPCAFNPVGAGECTSSTCCAGSGYCQLATSDGTTADCYTESGCGTPCATVPEMPRQSAAFVLVVLAGLLGMFWSRLREGRPRPR